MSTLAIVALIGFLAHVAVWLGVPGGRTEQPMIEMELESQAS